MKRVYCFAAVLILYMTAAFAADAVPLEQALDEAAATFSSRIKQGSTIVVVGISSDSNELSEFIADELSYKIYSLNKLKVAERKSLDAIKKEMNFQLSGEVSDDTIKQIGNMTGAATVIVGTFKSQRSHYLLTVKALNVSTAIVEAMHRAQVAQSETIINVIAKGDKASDYLPLDTGARYTGGKRFSIGMQNYFVFGLGSYLAGYTADGIGLTITHIIGRSLFWGGVGGLIAVDNANSDIHRRSEEAYRNGNRGEYERLSDMHISDVGPIVALSLGAIVEFGAFLYGCIIPVKYNPKYSKLGAVIKNVRLDFVADSRGAAIPRLAYKIEY